MAAIVLQVAIRDGIPGASGDLAGTAADRAAETPALVASAFTETFWWAAVVLLLCLISIFIVPRGSPPPKAPPTSLGLLMALLLRSSLQRVLFGRVFLK